MGFAPEVLKFIEGADFPLVITLHDFSYICPQVVLLNEHDLFCGVPFAPRCNQCVSAKPPILHTTNVGQWRENMRRLFSRAERISAPSETAAKLYRKIWPDLPIAVIPHPEKPLEDHLAVRAATGNVRTVAIVGTIGDHKGVTVVEGCVRDAEARKLPLKFAVVGEFQSQLESSYLDITGRFSPAQLPSILSTLGAGVGFLPSIWPETYSYVLSEYYRNGLHPVVFDIGAQSERVKASGYGTVLPVHTGAPAINDTLLRIKTELVARQPPTGLPDNEYVDACYGPLLFGNLGRAVAN
jgi:glycosyltransferase involved in cell wall biosynthesis